MEKKRYYSYKVYKDINPKSPTYGQFKYVRNPEKDDECTEKFAARWVLSRTACSLVPYGIVAPTDPYIETFKVDEYKDENPNSPTYNTYLYKQHGMCEAKVPEPKWTLVPEMSGASADPDKWDPNLINGEKRYCIDTYIDKEPRSKTYNQYKYVKCDREYDEVRYYAFTRLRYVNAELCKPKKYKFYINIEKFYNSQQVGFDGSILEMNIKPTLNNSNVVIDSIDTRKVNGKYSPFFNLVILPNRTNSDIRLNIDITVDLKILDNDTSNVQNITAVGTILILLMSEPEGDCNCFNVEKEEINTAAIGETVALNTCSNRNGAPTKYNITSPLPDWITCENNPNQLTITTKPNE